MLSAYPGGAILMSTTPSRQIFRTAIPLLLAALAGGLATEFSHHATAVQAQSRSTADELAALRADVERLKQSAPTSQSHTMMDVGFHWQNLWFAVEKRNWPLARFYFDETRSHIKWTIRIRPVRKGPDGQDVDIAAIFEALDTSVFKDLQAAIERKNRDQFVASYRVTTESCYSCHKSSGKPYLRPIIPTAPAQAVIAFDPNVTWPQ
jgi:hypothetical protein